MSETAGPARVDYERVSSGQGPEAARSDGGRGDLKDMFPRSRLAGTVSLAQAENLLAAHEAATKPLPSRWATIHAVDSAGVTGEIVAIPGGYRVHWLDLDVAPDAVEPAQRTRDIFAVHSIDWLTREDAVAHTEQAHKTCSERAKEYKRRRTWPEGYRLVKRVGASSLKYGLQRLEDNLVMGFWRDCSEPLTTAWECFDGSSGDFKDWGAEVEPCCDMPIPF